jgi:hypothetical protein
MQEGVKENFQQYLLVLKSFYCTSKEVNEGKPLIGGGDPFIILELLCASKLGV